MLSAYFKVKTKTDEFKNNIENIIENCKDKKVLLYGVDDGLITLNKIYNLTQRLNITAIVDETLKAGVTSKCCGIKVIPKEDLLKEQFDNVIILSECSSQVTAALEAEYSISCDKIYAIFKECIKEERQNLNFLYKNKFDKTYPKLVKKLKNKKVVLYGAGIFLELINKYFDLSKLNIIGIADKKYSIVDNKETFLGYKTYNPSEIKDLNPDYVLMSTKFYISLFEYLHFDLLQDSKIKVKPLMKKSFWTLLKEVIES